MKLLSNIHHKLFVYNLVASVPINKGIVTNNTLFFTTGKQFQRKNMLTFQQFLPHLVWHLVMRFILMCGGLVKSRPPS